MSILTQDTSRQFLNSAGPQDKYKSFLMATQLDKMTKDYTTIREHIDKIKDMLSQKVVVSKINFLIFLKLLFIINFIINFFLKINDR